MLMLLLLLVIATVHHKDPFSQRLRTHTHTLPPFARVNTNRWQILTIGYQQQLDPVTAICPFLFFICFPRRLCVCIVGGRGKKKSDPSRADFFFFIVIIICVGRARRGEKKKQEENVAKENSSHLHTVFLFVVVTLPAFSLFLWISCQRYFMYRRLFCFVSLVPWVLRGTVLWFATRRYLIHIQPKELLMQRAFQK